MDDTGHAYVHFGIHFVSLLPNFPYCLRNVGYAVLLLLFIMLGRAEPRWRCGSSSVTGGLEVRKRISSRDNIQRRSRGCAHDLVSMLGETGGMIPCRICLVLIMRMNARSFFFLHEEYVYLSIRSWSRYRHGASSTSQDPKTNGVCTTNIN